MATSSPVSLEALRKSRFVSSARVWCEVNHKGFLIKSTVGYGAKRANERTQFRLVRTMEFVFRCIARFSSRVHLVVSPRASQLSEKNEANNCCCRSASSNLEKIISL